MLLLLALYTTVLEAWAISVENLYKYFGKVNLIPLNECDGLISKFIYPMSVSHIICGTECLKNSRCDAYFHTSENGSTTCTLAAISGTWNPILEHSGNSIMYARACNADVNLPFPKDCKYLFDSGTTCDGIYTIYPDSVTQKQVYCDMHTAGGGWTAFQKRQDGSVNFNLLWVDYTNGFGNNIDYWIGNRYLADLTAGDDTEIFIWLEDWSCKMLFARYNIFKVSRESDNFRLNITGYSGNAGDSMYYNNGLQFSTKDVDNDEFPTACAVIYHSGGWWFKGCTLADLNGIYYNNPIVDDRSMHWNKFHKRTALKETFMMVRRK